MECPYCNGKMQTGVVTGDGRQVLTWTPDEKAQDRWDKWDKRIGGKGRILAANYSLATFRMNAAYCAACEKLIVDTKIAD